MSSSGSEDRLSPPSAQPRANVFVETSDLLSLSGESLSDTSSLKPREDLDERNIKEEDANNNSIGGDDEDESDVMSELSGPPDPERPTKTFAQRAAWLAAHAEEITTGKSLDKLGAQDLAVHLYNAHRLNIRSQAQRRATGNRKNRRSGGVWGPHGQWTAWPLPSRRVPREQEESDRHWYESVDAPSTIRGQSGTQSSKQVLEDILIGIAAKKARTRFAARDLDDSWPTSSKSNHMPGHSGNEFVIHDTFKNMVEQFQGLDEIPTLQVNPPEGTFLLEKAALKPVPLSDEDHIIDLLQKPVRHVLVQFDTLLLTLQYSQKAAIQLPDNKIWRRRGNGWTNDEGGSDNDKDQQTGVTSNTRKRKQQVDSVKDEQMEPEVQLEGTKPCSRPQEPLKGKQPTLLRERQRYHEHHSKNDRLNKFNDERAHRKLMDWSQILGFAAIAGLPAGAVQRARARCEQLFKQQMDFVGPMRPGLAISSDEGENETNDDQDNEAQQPNADFKMNADVPVKEEVTEKWPADLDVILAGPANQKSPDLPIQPLNSNLLKGHIPKLLDVETKRDLDENGPGGKRRRMAAQDLQHGLHTDWWAGSGPIERDRRHDSWNARMKYKMVFDRNKQRDKLKKLKLESDGQGSVRNPTASK